MANFIPSLHFDPPSSKLTPEWCMKGINYYVFKTHNRSLLHNKNIDEIDSYSTGDFDMRPFKKIFKSLKNQLNRRHNQNPDGSENTNTLLDDTTGLDWSPLALIPSVLNTAISVVHKIPVEVSCKAIDSLAMEKKKQDLAFLKNKPLIESMLQDVADKMQIGSVDLGSTKHSSVKYGSNPMGLDLNQPDEEDVFVKLMYSLKVEAALEKVLSIFDNIKNANQLRFLEIGDQYKWGVSSHFAFASPITGLLDNEYVFPGQISCPSSKLPDFSDNTHRIIDHPVTVMELFNYFSDEICDLEQLEKIINQNGSGYCSCNGKSKQEQRNWDTFKVSLKYIEIKSIDWVGIAKKEVDGQQVATFTENEQECSGKIWGQNTYGFWWLANTHHVFGIKRLGFSHRTKGKESYQNFSTNIYKSQEKSAVELAINENKKAQIADIKLQHALIKSLPNGKFFDLRFLRSALEGLNDEGGKYTIHDLINLLFEHNIMIGDTEGFDGKNDGQIKPFMEIPGGLRTEVTGYLTIIAAAIQNIGRITGVNQELTGASQNPEGLVGLQKLLINSSINAINYCNEAIKVQSQKMYNIWGYIIQDCMKKGGAAKQALIDFIGSDDAEVIEGLNDTPLHNISILVETGQREEERQEFRDELARLKSIGVLTTTDEYLLSGITNPRNQFALLAVREKKFEERKDQQQQDIYAQQRELAKQQSDTVMGAAQEKTDGKLKEVYAKGDVQAQALKLANQLGLNTQQFQAVAKKGLQDDRIQGQIDKTLKTIDAKGQMDNQKAFPNP